MRELAEVPFSSQYPLISWEFTTALCNYVQISWCPRCTLNPFKHSASHYRSNRSQSTLKFRYINQQSKYNSKEPYKMLMLTKQWYHWASETEITAMATPVIFLLQGFITSWLGEGGAVREGLTIPTNHRELL